MRYIDELSPREIAAVLGVIENVVSVRIHRGIQRLNVLMGQKPPNGEGGPQGLTNSEDIL